jgi:mannose-6-phosphate isomerase-like protein (cupin superfamily)
MSVGTTRAAWELVDFATIAGAACPCGTSRRALAGADDVPFTLHRVEVSTDARRHYHRRLTETYYVLDCEADARLELDGQVLPLRPGACVVIRPGVRHRALGRMTILNIVTPKFDPADECFD